MNTPSKKSSTPRQAVKFMRSESLLQLIARNQPATSRLLSATSGARIKLIRAICGSLRNRKLIKVAYKSNCPITSRRANFYVLISYKVITNG